MTRSKNIVFILFLAIFGFLLTTSCGKRGPIYPPKEKQEFEIKKYDSIQK